MKHVYDWFTDFYLQQFIMVVTALTTVKKVAEARSIAEKTVKSCIKGENS